MPSRLLSVGPRTVFGGVGRWTRVAPGQLPWHAPPRLLSASCADLSKHQEPPGKKPLSEKKLVRFLTLKEVACSSLSEARHTVLRSHFPVHSF